MKQTVWILCLLLSAALRAQPDAEAALADQYFADKEYDAALELYEKLYKKEAKNLYVTRIVDCYDAAGKFEDAIVFMDKAIKKQPDAILYPVMKAGILDKMGDITAADALYKDIIEKKLKSEGDFMQVSVFLFTEGNLDKAETAYLEGRKKLKNPSLFAAELGTIYDFQGYAGKATSEYLTQYYTHRETFENMSLAILNMAGKSKSSDAEIEKVLLAEVDKNAGDMGVRRILFEYYVLVKNFEEAFIQVKSMDKFFKEDGNRLFMFAETMRNNKRYDLSNKAYDYIIANKPMSPYFQRAYIEKATNGELRAFEQVPPDMNAIKETVNTYGDLIKQFGRNAAYFSAMYRKANLQVFYLNELEEPLAELKEVANIMGLQRDDWAKTKLLIADILLIQKDYSNAKLIYTEVSEAFKDRQVGAMAKFRLAQMAYYKGDFEMAAGFLSVIKDNTANDISNDAIQLNLRIIDNTGLDTTTEALSMYANAELLVYQHNYDQAMMILDSLAYKFPTHSLMDEIFWTKANIYLKQNDIPKTLEYLDRILAANQKDIYADDALYLKARLQDYTLKNPELALKLYLEFLSSFPGSLYSVEVRKRIRELRGS